MLMRIAIITVMLAAAVHAEESPLKNKMSLLVLLSKSNDGQDLWMTAINVNNEVVYFVFKKRGQEMIASEGSVPSLNNGPPLDKAYVNIELDPLSIQLNQTINGRALRLTKNGNLIDSKKVKTGVVLTDNQHLIACYRLKDNELLPKTEDDAQRIDIKFLKILKSSGQAEFEDDNQSDKISKETNEDIIRVP